jgi:hypothetical protein
MRYDLQGKSNEVLDIIVTAHNAQGKLMQPTVITGDVTDVKTGVGKTIWWEPQLEGLTLNGWVLTPKINYSKKLNINWILVEGDTCGNYYISATEVTFDQFDLFYEETGYKKPKDYSGRGKQLVV